MLRATAILLILIVGSCASSSQNPPSRLDNACVMKSERPSWFRAMGKAEAKWGVPVPVQMATIWRESRFQPHAKTPRKYFLGIIPNGRISSAYGYAQAVDGTWDWYREDTGRRFASRSDFFDATDFIGWYMTKTRAQNGIPLGDSYNQYLAYHEGHAGYARGSYRAKSFLLRAAGEVKSKTATYARQLATCS